MGRFDLADIPPAPRGIPQIEVTFDIDANGILHVSAKDKATNREQSIVIKASSGLSDEEIDRMVQDAEAHAAEDKKFHDLVTARNQADQLIHATKKSMEDLGSEVKADEKTAIEAAIADLEEVKKGDDLAAIEEKTKVLVEASGKVAERAYSKAQKGGEQPQSGAAADDAGASSSKDDVVDAEFEEVKDDK